jgi:hypothetical protein
MTSASVTFTASTSCIDVTAPGYFRFSRSRARRRVRYRSFVVVQDCRIVGIIKSIEFVVKNVVDRWNNDNDRCLVDRHRNCHKDRCEQ